MNLITKNILRRKLQQKKSPIENMMKEPSMENLEQNQKHKSPLQRRNERKGEGGRGML